MRALCDPFRRSCGEQISVAAGLLAAIGLSIQVSAGGPPGNDLCANAVDLNALITAPNYDPYSVVVDGTAATADNILWVTFDASVNVSNGIWYTFTSPGPGYLICSDLSHPMVDISNPGTIFSLIDDCNMPETIYGHEFDPRFSAYSIDETRSVYGFADAGETIKILVSSGIPEAGVGPSSGMYDLTFDFETSVVPANDTCANAEVIPALANADTYVSVVDNLLATDDSTACGPVSHGVWYTYTPTWTGYLAVDERSSQQSMLAYSTGCGSVICEAGERMLVPITAGQPVHVLVGSAFEELSLFEPLATTFALVPDECETAFPVLVGGSGTAILNYATPTAGGSPGMCDLSNFPNGEDLWFSVALPSTGEYLFELIQRGRMSIFQGGCPASGGVQIACTDDNAYYQTVQQVFSAGTYYVRIAGEYSSAFSSRLEVTAIVPSCAADFNGINGVTVQDIFDFLTAWLAGSASADFNSVNGVTVQDIFDFLTSWLAGC